MNETPGHDAPRTAWLLALAMACAFVLVPWPCAVSACAPTLFDEGILLRESADLARVGPREALPSYMGRPLHRWLQALSFCVVGRVPWAGVLVSSVSAALTVLVVFSIGLRLGGGRAGILAAALCALSNIFGHYSRTALAECDSLLFFMLAMRSVVMRCGDAGHQLRLRDFVPAGLWLGMCLAVNPRMALAAPWVALIGLRGLSLSQLSPRLGLGACLAVPAAFELAMRLVSRHPPAAASSFSLYVQLNASYFRPGSLFDSAMFLVVCEGPIFLALSLVGMAKLVRTPGLARDVACSGPALSYLIASLLFTHHALRYLVVFVPGFCLAMGLALARWLPPGPEPSRTARDAVLALVLAGAMVTARAPLPRGLNPVYPAVVDLLESRGAGTVLASNFQVIGLLRELRGATAATLPPVSSLRKLDERLAGGVTHSVLDFEQIFLGDYVGGKFTPDLTRPVLDRHLVPVTLDHAFVRGPYIWFEHGFLAPAPGLVDFDQVRIYDLRTLPRGTGKGF